MDKFDQKIEKLLKLRHPKIAFGLDKPDELILTSLRKSHKYADINIVGPKKISSIKGFKLNISNNPEKKLVEMLVNGEVEGMVRGTIDDFKTYEVYRKLTGENTLANPVLMQLPNKNKIFIAFVSNPEAWTKEDRFSKALITANMMIGFNIKPRICVLSGVRHDTYKRKRNIKSGIVAKLNKTYSDAQWIVKKLNKERLIVKNWSIDSNIAIEEGYNLLIPPNGMVGNQMFRMILASGGKLLIGTKLGLSHYYEDNSRTEKDFEFHIKWLVAMINQKKNGRL
ncbi:hypothetical protein KKH39_04160 [Patescibacteria group bacterium]|nr:hypothetical protein [Patescibacteria group bacterium]